MAASARRDLVKQNSDNDGTLRCIYVALADVEGSTPVSDMDSVEGTPLLDLKPDRAFSKPIAPQQARTSRWIEDLSPYRSLSGSKSMNQSIFDIDAIDGVMRKSHLTQSINPHGDT